MKRLWGFILLLAAELSAAELECVVRPNPAVKGGVVEVTLRSDRAMPKIAARPAVEGARWIDGSVRTGYSSSYSTSGGRKTLYSATSALRVERAGEVTIPPIEVTLDGKSRRTEPVTIKVSEAPAPPAEAAGEAYFGRFLLPERRICYIGEEVPFTLEFFSRQGEEIQFSYPRVTIPHAVFREYRENPENPRFAPPAPPRIETIDGVRYQVQALSGAFRSLAAGTVTPEAAGELSIVRRPAERSRPRSPFDDDFFAPFGIGREVEQRRLVFPSPGAIEFRSPPPPPAGAAPLGLTGDWRVSCELEDHSRLRVGEVMTLVVSVSGSGSGEGITPPALDLPGFRVYPPEVRHPAPGRIRIEYQLIPLRPGKAEIRLAPAVFDPVSGRYRVTDFFRAITVAAAERGVPAATAPAAPEPTPEPAAKPVDSDPAPHDLAPRPAGAPRAKAPWIAGLLLAGPVIWAWAAWLRRRRERRMGDEAWLRRRRARAGRAALCRRLMRVPDADFGTAVLNEAVPLLADYYALPPGSTADEVAARIPDPALAEELRKHGLAAYRPGSAPPDMAERRRFARALKKLLALVTLAAAGGLSADDFAAGSAAYDAGDFAAARRYFAAAAAAAPRDAAVLGNLGRAAFMEKDYPRALAAFEAARRYAPRDPELLDDLNLTRARLGLPAAGGADSPAALLRNGRDAFSPAGWLVAAAAVWCGAFLLLIAWRRFDRLTRAIVFGTLALIFVSALAAAWTAYRGPYSPARAIVAAGGADMRNLPTAHAPPEATVPAGREVRIVERRGDRALIDWNGRSGWVETARLHPVFP